MPDNEIIKMTAKELTYAVAAEVMGWTIYDDEYCFVMDDDSTTDFDPEDYADHRDMIVDRLRYLGWFMTSGNYIDRIAGFAKPHTGPGDAMPKEFIGRHKDNMGIAVMIAAYHTITGQRVRVEVSE